MTTPTAAEQLLLDTEPQSTDLFLSIYEPELALICTISGSSYSQTNQTINYSTIISGSISNINDYYFQVALIGTSPNSDDIGRTWIRSVSGNTLRFVESDHIDWASATYITVLKYTEIIPVFPRIISNPNNAEDVIFYKIWDIAYTNQNSILGSFVNMGSHYAGFLENGTGTCYWTASGTSNLLGDGLTYSWIFEGAVITGSTAHTPGYVAYNQAGHHRTILRVASSSGRTDTSIRYTSFYDRPGAGNNTPLLNWEFSEFSGSRESIGYSCRIKVREIIPESKIRDGSLVVIFGEDWYGATKQSISKNAKGRENIKFVGYINAGTIQYNYADGWVEFEVISSTKFMEICEGFSCSVESKTNPTTWYELINMDVRRAVYHYLAWQSSVLLCCDVEFKNFVDRYIQYFDADRTSLYDAINSVISGARGGRAVSDSLGKIWIEQEPDVLSSSLPTALTINKKDWIDEPIIDERHHQQTSFIELGGIAYNPATNASNALLSNAPGVAPAYRGKPDRKQGWALLDQAELNTMIGDKFAYMNSRYPNIDLSLRGNYNNLDIAPQEKVLLNIAQNDTPRNITFSNKEFAIRGVDWSWDAKAKRLYPKVSLAEITNGYDGVTIIIPAVPPEEGGDGGTYKKPPIQVPPIPTVTPTTTVIVSGTVSKPYCYLALLTSDNWGGSYTINWGDGGYAPYSDKVVSTDYWYPSPGTDIIIPEIGAYFAEVNLTVIPTVAHGDGTLGINNMYIAQYRGGAIVSASIGASMEFEEGSTDPNWFESITASEHKVFYCQKDDIIRVRVGVSTSVGTTTKSAQISILGI